MGYLQAHELRTLAAAADRLVPPTDDGHPGAAALGVVDYIDGLLDAFSTDPPRIWAGGPFSGRAGGDTGFVRFMDLSSLEELAWRTRIEGSQGIPERERMGPITGWQAQYHSGLSALGADFGDLDSDQQTARLDADPEFRDLLYEHVVEGCYAAPEYGGNRNLDGWRAIDFPGDVQPRGYTDAEVEGRA
ncbi:MAG: gluconate 2-dehydrogenase subunit 3 family protein [Acidimicrobiia bacterium]|nr:gluconate 2-dehydrogenase subunit 3 family protein [Acidimicrobiia bacterium]